MNKLLFVVTTLLMIASSGYADEPQKINPKDIKGATETYLAKLFITAGEPAFHGNTATVNAIVDTKQCTLDWKNENGWKVSKIDCKNTNSK